MNLALSQLKEIMPGAMHLELFLEPIIATLEEFNIASSTRAAAFIAQLAHESGQFVYMAELANGAAYDNRADLGNTTSEAREIAARHGTSTGRWWKGHGPIQITGYTNHKRCGEYLGLDLLENPRLLEQPLEGCRSAGWFWAIEKNLNPLADAGDFLTITRRINGGVNGLADRQQFWERAKVVLQFIDVEGGAA